MHKMHRDCTHSRVPSIRAETFPFFHTAFVFLVLFVATFSKGSLVATATPLLSRGFGSCSAAASPRGVIVFRIMAVIALPASSAATAGIRSPAASFGNLPDENHLEADLLKGQLVAGPSKESHRPFGGLVDGAEFDTDGFPCEMGEVILQLPVENERDIRIELFLELPELAVSEFPGTRLKHGKHEHVVARVMGKGIEHPRPLDTRAGRGRIRAGQIFPKEPLIKSHRGRCGKNGPRARRLRGSIPAAGCNREANRAPGLLSPQPEGLKPFVDFYLAVSRRPRPSDCFAGHIVSPDTRCCGVARSGETAAGIAQHLRLQKSANGLQRPSWDLISGSPKETIRRA